MPVPAAPVPDRSSAAQWARALPQWASRDGGSRARDPSADRRAGMGLAQRLSMRITHGSHTDTGRRSNNEDALIAAPDLGFFAVADGMGGTEGGEVASALALDTLHRYFERVGDSLDLVSEPGAALAQMRMAIRMAHRAVQRAAVGTLRDMGTTVVCLLVRGERARGRAPRPDRPVGWTPGTGSADRTVGPRSSAARAKARASKLSAPGRRGR